MGENSAEETILTSDSEGASLCFGNREAPNPARGMFWWTFPRAEMRYVDHSSIEDAEDIGEKFVGRGRAGGNFRRPAIISGFEVVVS